MLDAHVIHATLERVGFDVFHAAHVLRFKAQGELVLAIFERGVAREAHGSQMAGQGGLAIEPEQTRLRFVGAAGAAIEQNNVFVGIELVFLGVELAVLEQLGANDVAAFAGKNQLEHIGADFPGLRWRRWGLGGRGLRAACNRLGRCGGRRNRGCGWGRRGQAGGGVGCRAGCWLGLGEEGGVFAVVNLPGVPQHHKRKRKNCPQQGAPNIVHGDVFSVETREVNKVPAAFWLGGTGSWPPAHQGWQRSKRRALK